MKINILRGQNQIGGSIIEITTDSTRIILDVGKELEETDDIEVPDIDGLFAGEANVDAVLISHFHADHVGLFPYIIPGIPIYMGKISFDMLKASYDYRDMEVTFCPVLYVDEEPFEVGDIKITPFQCDHSAYDSYMFLIEQGGEKVLYTGDYRANGRADYEKLLQKLPTVDTLITEGTILSRDSYGENIKEEDLEEIAVQYVGKHIGPVFFMMSAMNVDRLITAYNISKRTGKTLLEDLYTAQIAKATENDLIIPSKEKDIRVFLTRGGDEAYNKLLEFGSAKIGKKQIANTPFVMCIRQSMKNYLKTLNELIPFDDGVLFYGMWKGYMDNPKVNEFLEFMKSLGVHIHVLHTSGHADMVTIEKLIEDTNPKRIIPVHTENAAWFEKYADKKEN